MAKAASTTSEFEPEVVQEIPPYQSALSIGSIYTPRPVKRRRATKAEVVARRNALREIVSAMQPMTVRQVFYQATVQALVDKSEVGYRKVQNDLVLMRRTSLMPYEWLTDNTRWQRKPKTYESVEQALRETARLYRKALWTNAAAYVEIWLEKDALAGVIYPITYMYDVPLMVTRGYASLSFLYSAAEYIKTLDVPAYIYHLGDFDPSGVSAGEDVERKLREFAPSAKIIFERLAVTPEQIGAWRLPTRPTKLTDARSKNFGDRSVELDAIEPRRLRSIVTDAIEAHLPAEQYEVLKAAEDAERIILQRLVRIASP